MYYVQEKTVLVLGAARSGVAAAKLLSLRGAHVLLADDKTPEKFPESFLEEIRRIPRVTVQLGRWNEKIVEHVDLVVVSPGVPLKHPAVAEAQARGIPLIGELEFASAFCPCPIAAVTGTNGKTTTVRMLEHLFRTAGKEALACGNIGLPFSQAVFQLSQASLAVLEVSSFQLETVQRFHPEVAVLLNITPDHLDRHGDMQTYVETKARIFENQEAQDAAVLNLSDRYTPLLSGYVKGRLYTFGILEEGKTPVQPGCYWKKGVLELLGQKILKQEDFPLPGRHNMENAAAAALTAFLFGVGAGPIAEGLSTFSGVEHRLEPAGEVEGVRFWNDSKATNIASTATALAALEGPIVLLLGGRDKGADFSELIAGMKGKVSRVVAFGECREKISRQLSPFLPVVEAGDFEEAVRGAFSAARGAGACVLFSPACASFDLFRDFEERGKKFKALVAQLNETRASEVSP